MRCKGDRIVSLMKHCPEILIHFAWFEEPLDAIDKARRKHELSFGLRYRVHESTAGSAEVYCAVNIKETDNMICAVGRQRTQRATGLHGRGLYALLLARRLGHFGL